MKGLFLGLEISAKCDISTIFQAKWFPKSIANSNTSLAQADRHYFPVRELITEPTTYIDIYILQHKIRYILKGGLRGNSPSIVSTLFQQILGTISGVCWLVGIFITLCAFCAGIRQNWQYFCCRVYIFFVDDLSVFLVSALIFTSFVCVLLLFSAVTFASSRAAYFDDLLSAILVLFIVNIKCDPRARVQ